jgi:hypothetical protein
MVSSMKRFKRGILASLVFLFLFGLLAWRKESAAAQAPVRQTTIVVPYTEYEWWLISWADNQILCDVKVDHEGLPTANEVLKACGSDIYQEWLNTHPCRNAATGKGDISSCQGLYFHFVSSQPKQREVKVQLPPAVAWLSLDGCTPIPPLNRCSTLPSLLITGEEPLPNERITAVRGIYNGVGFKCDSPSCKIPLSPTPLEGVTLEFWVDSSYGDSSEHYTAQVRVVDTGVSLTPGGGGYYVDVISSQWRGAEIASCARTWQAFPPIGEPPTWLSTPDQSHLIASDAPYYYLAGRLIAQGLVNGLNCPTGGLQPNGYADACGLEKARPLVEQWQNKFDTRIIDVAKQTGVPAQLMKNLFAQESQFWPGVFRVPYEFGLGQLTDKGAETVLLWDPTFYNQFCPLVLSADACGRGYLHLSSNDQALLRGALAGQVRADCPSCASGIDLTNVDFSVSLFAKTLQANCVQVGQIIQTNTKRMPGSVASYEDLWKFTVANYHAGPGCVAYAISSAWQNGGMLTWDKVSADFTEPCKGVVPYVNGISK